MLRGRLDRERGQRERHGERDVVALGARGRGPTVRGMRLVHPHRRLDETSELGVTAAGLELDAESEPRGTPRVGRARQRGTARGRLLDVLRVTLARWQLVLCRGGD